MAAPAIGRRARWAPPVHAKVDSSHPLAAGLIFCDWFPEGQPIERQATRTGERTVSPLGAGCGNTGATGAATYSSSALYFPPATTLTHVVAGRWTMASGTYLTQCVAAAASDGEITWYRNGSDIGFYVDAGTDVASWLPVQASAENLDLVLGFTVDTAAWISYVNGRVTNSDAKTLPDLAASTSLGVGCKADGTSGVPGVVNLYAIWHRALTAGEHAMLAADPFCMMRI